MSHIVPWGEGLLSGDELTSVGLESLITNLEQGPRGKSLAPYFKPVNIVTEDGIHYVTLYVCCLHDDDLAAQEVAIWFASLKQTDHVKLSVSSMYTPVSLSELITLMSAIASTKAKVEILLDQIVIDNLAYFYLIADVITHLDAGALFIPSYVVNRRDDNSVPWKAIHDFYDWIVDDAVQLGRLTAEEGEQLRTGHHVVLAEGRFSK